MCLRKPPQAAVAKATDLTKQIRALRDGAVAPPQGRGSRFRPEPGAPGFTFIEVMVVLFLLAVVMGLTVPAFQAVIERDRDREMNRLGAVLHLMRSEAILSRRALRLEIDLSNAAYWVERQDEKGQYAPLPEPRSFRRYELPSSLELLDVVLYGGNSGRLTREVVPLRVDSSGFIDPFLLHFRDGQTEWTFRVSGFTGKTDLVEGYRDDFTP